MDIKPPIRQYNLEQQKIMTCEAKKPAHLFNSSTVVILGRQFLDQVQDEHNLVIVVGIYL